MQHHSPKGKGIASDFACDLNVAYNKDVTPDRDVQGSTFYGSCSWTEEGMTMTEDQFEDANWDVKDTRDLIESGRYKETRLKKPKQGTTSQYTFTCFSADPMEDSIRRHISIQRAFNPRWSPDESESYLEPDLSPILWTTRSSDLSRRVCSIMQFGGSIKGGSGNKKYLVDRHFVLVLQETEQLAGDYSMYGPGTCSDTVPLSKYPTFDLSSMHRLPMPNTFSASPKLWDPKHVDSFTPIPSKREKTTHLEDYRQAEAELKRVFDQVTTGRFRQAREKPDSPEGIELHHHAPLGGYQHKVDKTSEQGKLARWRERRSVRLKSHSLQSFLAKKVASCELSEEGVIYRFVTQARSNTMPRKRDEKPDTERMRYCQYAALTLTYDPGTKLKGDFAAYLNKPGDLTATAETGEGSAAGSAGQGKMSRLLV